MKVVTCHAGARDGYNLSVALHQMGVLEKLVTDFYTPSLIRQWLPQRHNVNLPSSKTISLWSTYIIQKYFTKDFLFTDKILSNKAFNVARKTRSNLFLTSYTAFEAFERAIKEEETLSRLLFQIHPHPLTVKRILTDELKYSPEAEFSINAEHEMAVKTEMLSRLDKESHMATNIVVASQFTKDSLIENGIRSEKVLVIPYGVNTNNFPAKLDYDQNTRPLKILFVGQMVQRKGLSYLFQALKSFENKNFELTIVGRGRFDEKLLDKYRPFVEFNVVKSLTHQALIDCFHNHDVMVLPSLIEGFGHVILEAMSSGLPVICTTNTAGPDLFLSHNEGFIIPIRDSDAIVASLDQLLTDKSKLKSMGRSAAATARIFTWERHIKGIQDFYLNNSNQ